MKISIITVTFNSAKTITNCILSLNTQTYNDIEHLIIDGGSKDQTLNIIRSESNHILKVISEPDNGIYDAINKGIKAASGEIIGILHSDDQFASDSVLEQVNETFLKYNADVVYGDLFYVKYNNPNKIIRYWKSKAFDKLLISKGWMPAHPTVFIRMEVFKKHGLYDLQFRISSDYDFMLRIMQDKELRFEYLPAVITKMRLGGASNRSLKNIIIKSHEDYRAIKKNGLSNPMLVLFRKNFSKVSQFFH